MVSILIVMILPTKTHHNKRVFNQNKANNVLGVMQKIRVGARETSCWDWPCHYANGVYHYKCRLSLSSKWIKNQFMAKRQLGMGMVHFLEALMMVK